MMDAHPGIEPGSAVLQTALSPTDRARHSESYIMSVAGAT